VGLMEEFITVMIILRWGYMTEPDRLKRCMTLGEVLLILLVFSIIDAIILIGVILAD